MTYLVHISLAAWGGSLFTSPDEGLNRRGDTVARFHLAKANIGRVRAPLEDPIMEGFRVFPIRSQEDIVA
jgi:hypothetical protein